jgi:gas vesicle protein
MAKTKDKVSDATTSVKPFVERALGDEKLRDDVQSAFATAKKVYEDLMGSKDVDKAAGKVLDKKLHKDLREAVEDLRDAALRIQGKKQSGRTGRRIVIAGIALGILFNPVTGPETRRWLKDLAGGGGGDFGGDFGSSAGPDGGPDGGSTSPS